MGLWSKKSIAEIHATAESGPYQLHRALSAWDLVLFGIGAIIGAGLFSLTGIAAAENAGPAIILSFIIAAIGCSFAALCYSELASMIPVTGSAYTYAYATMGEFVACMIGWDLILEYAIGAATVSISWSAYIVSLLEDLGIPIPTDWVASPWQPVKLNDGSTVYGFINFPAVIILGLVTFINVIGIRDTVKVNSVIVILKVSVVLVFIGLGAFYIQPQNYVPFIPENTGTFGEFGWSGILRAAGVIFFAYIGFDSVSTTAQETKNPQKDIPIGILGSLAICSILYVLFAIVLTGLLPYQLLNVAAPVALAIDQTPFFWISQLVKLAILAGFTSVMLVTLLGQSRIFYAMSKDGLLPKWFSDVHPKWRTPWRANIILFIFVSLFGAFAPITLVGHMTSIGTLLAFSLVCGSVIILRYTDPDRPRPFRVPFNPITPLLGVAVCFLMMASLGMDSWLRLGGWLLIGLAIYFGYGRYRSRKKDEG